MGPFLLGLEEYSRLKALPILSSTVIQRWSWFTRTHRNVPIQLGKRHEHKKTFPLNLKFATDLNSLIELFASRRLVVLLHVSKTAGLSHMTTEFAYIETVVSFKVSTGHDYSIQMDYKLRVEDRLTPHDFFQNAPIVKEVYTSC